MSFADLLWSLPGVVAAALVGRLLLDRLPAGTPACPGAPARGAVWAAGGVLGLGVLGAQTWLLERATGRPGVLLLGLPWLLLGLWSRLEGPGDVAPRAPLSLPALHPSERNILRALRVASLAGLLWTVAGFSAGAEAGTPRLPLAPGPLPAHLALEWPLWLAGGERPGLALGPWLLLATAVLVDAGLVELRLPALPRGALVLFLVSPPTGAAWIELCQAPRTALAASAALTLAAVGTLAWVRRAERRGRALALVGSVLLAAVEPVLLGVALALLVLLAVASPPPTRGGTWGRVLPVAGLALLLAGGPAAGPTPGAPLGSLAGLATPLGVWLPATVVALVLRLRRGRPPAEVWVLPALLAASLALAPLVAGGRGGSPLALLEASEVAWSWPGALVPLAVLCVGAALAPALRRERAA